MIIHHRLDEMPVFVEQESTGAIPVDASSSAGGRQVLRLAADMTGRSCC